MAPALSLPGGSCCSPRFSRRGLCPRPGGAPREPGATQKLPESLPPTASLGMQSKGQSWRVSRLSPWGLGFQSHQGGQRVQVVPVGQRGSFLGCLTRSATLDRKVGTGTKSLFSTRLFKQSQRDQIAGLEGPNYSRLSKLVIPWDEDSPRSPPLPPQLPAPPLRTYGRASKTGALQ